MANKIRHNMMTNEEAPVNQRLNLIVDTFERGVKSAFAQKIGISPQGAHDLLSGRKGAPSFKALTGILNAYPEVNADWLVRGKGHMLISESVQGTHQIVARAIAQQEQALKDGDLAASEMAIIQLRQLNARLHGEDVEHPHILKARADAEQEALSRVYSVADDYPRGPGSQLSVRLDVSEATARQLVTTGKIRAVDVGEGYRTSEQAVREFLKQA